MALALVFVCEDGHVCPTCVGAAREPRRFADMRPGENYPPLHPRCRCVVNPHVTDWDAWLDQQADREAARTKARRMGASVAEQMPKNTGRFPLDTVKVDWAKVDSRSYEKGMSRLVGKRLAGIFVEKARAALKHRDGSEYEDLYALNLTTGDFVSVLDYPTEREVIPDDDMLAAINGWVEAGQDFAMLHNHPNSRIPSMSDIRALRARGARFGVIACHDGSLYRYEIVGEPRYGNSLENDSLVDYIDNRAERKTGRIPERVYAEVEESWGVRIERIA